MSSERPIISTYAEEREVKHKGLAYGWWKREAFWLAGGVVWLSLTGLMLLGAWFGILR